MKRPGPNQVWLLLAVGYAIALLALLAGCASLGPQLPAPPADEDGAQSFALVCDDPDAPHGTFTHWVLYNLPAHTRELAPDVRPDFTLANGARQGINDFGRIGYGGPAPPKGKPEAPAPKGPPPPAPK